VRGDKNMTWQQYYEAHKLEFDTLPEHACEQLEREYDMYLSPEALANESYNEEYEEYAE
jgi:hypothetical protein